MKYDPLVEPDSKRWLEADEMERLNLVLKYHRRTRVELPNEHLHTAIHLTVENQAALGDETPVAQALQRLMSEGLCRHDAIHAVGSVLADHIWKSMRERTTEVTDLNEAYFNEVRDLTAQKWYDDYGDTEE